MKIEIVFRTEGQADAVVAEVESETEACLFADLADVLESLARPFRVTAGVKARQEAESGVVRPCCYDTDCSLCASREQLLRCCYPLSKVCPSHG